MRSGGGTWLATGMLLAGAGCATVPRAPAKPEVKPPPPTLEEVLTKIDRAVGEEVTARHWPDLAIGVVADGKLRWWKGYGEVDAQSHAPVTDKTYFRYGSITKTVTGLALLQLRDEGKLSLDDPLEKFIPEVKGVVYPTAEHTPIRLRHLVTHTSGLPRYPDGLDYVHHVPTEAELVALLRGMDLNGTPGAYDEYSNYANCLAGVVIHRVSGMPYQDWISSHIAEPLGVGFRWTEESVPPGRLAMGHELGPKEKGSPMMEVPHGWVMGACNSCGGLYGSLDDLAKYAAFELSAWPPRDAPESPVATRATLRESQTLRSTEFGVNWIIHEDAKLGRVVWHNGGVGGYCAELWMVPDRGIAVVALLGFGDGEADLQRTVKSSLADLEGVFPETPPGLGLTMRSRIDQLVALLEPNAGPVPKDFFTKEFLRFVLEKKETVEGGFSALRQRGGHCRVSTLRAASANAATFRLDCAHGAIDVSLAMSTRSPHAISAFGFEFPR